MAALYSCAANIIDKVLKKHGTVKSLAINSHFRKKKKLYALVCETLKYSQILQEIFEQTKLLKLEKKLKPNYALVLVYDFLFGQGIQCGGELKQSIMKHKSALQSCLARLKVRAKVHRNEDLLPKHALEIDCILRYVRSNRIKSSVGDVILEFKQNGFEQVHPKNVGSFVRQTKKIRSKQFMCDNHLPDVLVFPPGTDLHDHPLFVSGRIALQDKASCLPAHVLHPPPGSHVIDACAAPGNKSSHLASLMNNKGKIFAFDIDNKRLTVMQKLMVTAGASCVTTTNCSFMEVDPLDERYSNVEYIVVDPSCSGSGIVSRMDKCVNEVEETSDKKQRLESLAKFQLSALNHALSFPFVKRVVYSTCSIHQQENEDVVAAALKANSDRFQLEHCLPSWTHRGLDVFQGADKCIRASPIEDYTNGFFVALFVRKGSKTENKFAESKDTSTEREGKLENEDMNGENSSLSAFQIKDSKMPLKSRPDAVASKDSDLSTRRKRRKRNNKKRKEAKSQGDPPAEPSVGNSRLINDKTKRNQRKKKKKNKKVSVCS